MMMMMKAVARQPVALFRCMVKELDTRLVCRGNNKRQRWGRHEALRNVSQDWLGK